jgi:hypothetical protein
MGFAIEQVMNQSIGRPFLAIEMIAVSALRPHSGNARRHSCTQIKRIAISIETFGFTNPILVSDDLEISLPGTAAWMRRGCSA